MSNYQPACGDPSGDTVRCWCGVVGRYDDLFDDTGLPDGCGGLGVLHCECGGDLCVCHHHGEVPCDGCEDCEDEVGGRHDDDFYGEEYDQ